MVAQREVFGFAMVNTSRPTSTFRLKKMPLDLFTLSDSEEEEQESSSAPKPNKKSENFISFDDSDDEDAVVFNQSPKIENKETTTEEKIEEEQEPKTVAQVSKTKDNILSLFSNAQSKWSHHYNIDMALQQKLDGKPILTSSVKERIAALKSKKKGEQPTPATAPVDTTNNSEAVSSSSEANGTNVKMVNDELIIEEANEAQSPTANEDSVIDITEDNEEESAEGYIKIDDFISNHSYNYEAHNAYSRYKSDVPWQTRDYSSFSPPLRLHLELMDFYNFVKQTKEEEVVRERVLDKVTRLCKSIDSDCKIQLFGSYPAGLMLPGSDLDLHVISRSKSQKTFLEKLNRELRKSNDFVEVNFIRNANVPIVKFKEATSLQEVDVSCNNNDTDASVEFIKRSSERYPAFKYLCYFLKYFLKQRNLNMVLTGGLSSYGLSLMIISHLQMHSSNSNIDERDVTSLGTLLLDFFALYGRYFNYYFTAISPQGEGKYSSYVMKIRQGHSAALKFTPNIIDPTNPSNNVSKGSSCLLSIRNSFSNAFDALISPTNINKESLLSTVLRISPDLCWRRIYIHQDSQYISQCAQYANTFSSSYGEEQVDEALGKKRSKSLKNKQLFKKKKF